MKHVVEYEEEAVLPYIIDSFPSLFPSEYVGEKDLPRIADEELLSFDYFPDGSNKKERTSEVIQCLQVQPDDSREMQEAKRKAMEKLALKGYPEAQGKMVVLYSKEGDMKRAQAMAQRLSTNEFADTYTKEDAQKAYDLLVKKSEKTSSMRKHLQEVEASSRARRALNSYGRY